jgi:uncharacterized protein
MFVVVPELPTTDVWVDDRVTVARSSIAGRGLFATEDIGAGVVLVRLGGRLVTTAELFELIDAAENDPGAPYVDTITVYEDAHLVLPAGTVAHFANHSCDPNLWHIGPYELATRLEVRAGEELTVDYGASSGADGFVMECSCGSARCRKRVTSTDWQLSELRARYDGHFTPALQYRIEHS